MASPGIDALIQQCQEDVAALQERLFALRDPTPETTLSHASVKAGYSPTFVDMKPRHICRGHFDKIYALSWNPDVESRKLVSASQDGRLLIWNGMTTNKVGCIPLRSSWVMTCAYSPSGTLIASGGLDNICTINRAPDPLKGVEGKTIADLALHEGYISSCRFIDDNYILTGSGDSKCILWDVNKQTPVSRFIGHFADVAGVSVAPAGAGSNGPSLFASGACDNTARLWDIRVPNMKSKCVMTFVGHESDVNAVEWFPDGNAIVTGSDDSSCRLFDVRAMRQLQVCADQKLVCGISSVAVSSSGRFIFCGADDYNAYMWDTLTAKQMTCLSHHQNRVSCLGLNKDGKALATGSWDATLSVWA